MKKMIKLLIVLLCILCFLVLAVFLFINLYRPFGGVPNKEDMNDYQKRSSNFKDGKFYNDNFSLYSDWTDPYSDRTTGKGVKPVKKIKSEKFNYQKNYDVDDVLITWFGHSTVLIQMHNQNILIDPIFSERSSPFSFVGPKRFSEIPASVKMLPHIDMVVLTHDHYDHVDYKTLEALKNKVDKFIVPLGIDKDLEKFGIDKSKITNMAWWEEINVDGLLIACCPSRHFAGRYIIDSGKALWSSWIFKDEYNTIFNSGDGGYGEHFKQIKEKYGDISLSLLDSAQYNVRWHGVHMFPEEAVDAAIDLGSKVAMPVHFGAFVLSNHAWDDPVHRFTRRAKELNLEYMSPKLGQTVSLKNYKNYQTEWWKNIK